MEAVWEMARADVGRECGRERQRNRGRKEGKGGGGEKSMIKRSERWRERVTEGGSEEDGIREGWRKCAMEEGAIKRSRKSRIESASE